MSSEYEYESTDDAVSIVLSVETPEHIRRLVEGLFRTKYAGAGSEQHAISADEIPADELRILNAFAASVAQVRACSITVIYDCGTCHTGGHPGDLVLTDAGTQCWSC